MISESRNVDSDISEETRFFFLLHRVTLSENYANTEDCWEDNADYVRKQRVLLLSSLLINARAYYRCY